MSILKQIYTGTKTAIDKAKRYEKKVVTNE